MILSKFTIFQISNINSAYSLFYFLDNAIDHEAVVVRSTENERIKSPPAAKMGMYSWSQSFVFGGFALRNTCANAPKYHPVVCKNTTYRSHGVIKLIWGSNKIITSLRDICFVRSISSRKINCYSLLIFMKTNANLRILYSNWDIIHYFWVIRNVLVA